MNNLSIVGLILIPFVATFYALWLLIIGEATTLDVAMCLVGAFATEFGVTFGYHRLIVHKSFVAHPVVKAVVSPRLDGVSRACGKLGKRTYMPPCT